MHAAYCRRNCSKRPEASFGHFFTKWLSTKYKVEKYIIKLLHNLLLISFLAVVVLVVGLISGSIAYFDKCYCPGKDPFLNRNAPLREKMYQLKTEYTSQNLEVKYRPGIVLYDAKIQILFHRYCA